MSLLAKSLPPGPTKSLDYEDLAIKEASDQQARILRAAKAAFADDRDPLRIFAETVAYSSTAHVNSMIALQRAHAERMRALLQSLPPDSRSAPTTAIPSVLAMFGVEPINPSRFRVGAAIVAVILALAFMGLGRVL